MREEMKKRRGSIAPEEVAKLAEKAQKKIERPPVNVSETAKDLQNQIGKLRKTETVEKSGFQFGKVVDKKPVEEVVVENAPVEEVVVEQAPVEEVVLEETGNPLKRKYEAIDERWDAVADDIEALGRDHYGRRNRDASQATKAVDGFMNKLAGEVGAVAD